MDDVDFVGGGQVVVIGDAGNVTEGLGGFAVEELGELVHVQVGDIDGDFAG